MNKEISNELFDRILKQILELNMEERKALENGETYKAIKLNDKVRRRLDILNTPISAYRSNK